VRNITQQKEQEPGFRLDIGGYTRILWRKKYFVLVPLAIAFIVASIGVRFLVPEYESSSLIRVGSPNTVSTDVNRFLEGRGGRDRDEKTLVQLQADILGSNFLDEVIRRIGIDRDPEVIARAELQHHKYPALSTEELVSRRLRDFLRRRIKIESDAPELFRISYADPNPDACYIIASSLSQLYIEMQQRQTLQSYQDVGEFSEEQLAVQKEKLDRAERALTDYQQNIASSTVGIANPVGPTNVAISEKVRADLSLTVRASESTTEKIRSRIASALGSMPSGDPIWRDYEVSKLVNELGDRRESELLVELGNAERRIDPTLDPVLASQQALQRRLQQIVLEAYPTIPDDYRPLVVEYFYQQAEVRAYRRKLQRLDEYIGRFRYQVARAPQTETELARLRDEVDRTRAIYNTFKEGEAQAEIGERAQSTEISRTVSIIEAPSRPVEPVRPDKIKILALCFLFGATVGAAGLLLTEFTDSSYRNVEDVERQLGLRVLGTIPRVGNARWVSESSRKRTVIWVAVCVTFLCVSISAFYLYGKSSREQLIELNPALSTKAKVNQP
jgi:uncharacterized protein involved in exopolysaccharide biosynthesis